MSDKTFLEKVLAIIAIEFGVILFLVIWMMLVPR